MASAEAEELPLPRDQAAGGGAVRGRAGGRGGGRGPARPRAGRRRDATRSPASQAQHAAAAGEAGDCAARRPAPVRLPSAMDLGLRHGGVGEGKRAGATIIKGKLVIIQLI